MIFWRIVDNKVHHVNDVEKLGFEKSENLRIPDEYLEKKEFVILRTAHGIGDWGIISTMPRLLKEKYPDCKVYVPSKKMLQTLFDNSHNNVHAIFNNNPYVDEFIDGIDGEIFHDHYRIYDNDNTDVPLIKQMLTFWQFTDDEMKDSQPELYWNDDEKYFGDQIIKEYIGDKEFGGVLLSDRFGTLYGKHDEEVYKNDEQKITKLFNENKLPYFYWTYKPLKKTPFDFIDKILDMRNMDLRIQLYIRSKAKLNIGNQCGTLQTLVRYSKIYNVQRQFPIAHNIVDGEIYL